MLKKNDLTEAEITGFTSEGNGVCRVDGQALFVPAAAPGDRLEVRVVKAKKAYGYGKIERILAQSPLRRPPDCAAFPACGGCSYRHINYQAELSAKEQAVADALNRIGGLKIPIEPITPAPETNRYRNKGQYPAGVGRNGTVVFGFYARGSHRLIELDDCLLTPPVFSEILAEVSAFANETGLTIYNEETGRGILRHVYIRQGERTGELLVCLVINGNRLPSADCLINRLTARFQSVVGILLNKNTASTNVVLGAGFQTLYGRPYIIDTLCGLTFQISASAFYQVNRRQAEAVYRQAMVYLAPSGRETVLDLYCGIGTIGLTMANSVGRLIGADLSAAAVADAEANAARNGIGNARFLQGDALEVSQTLKAEGIRPGAVIVDPPRKGLPHDLIGLITNVFSPAKVVYISCDPATLARDLRLFGELGYKAMSAVPFDMFPGTPHVETIVLLQRQDT